MGDIVINKATFDKLLKLNNPADCIALYSFYVYTAVWQGTNKPKCTTAYTAKGIGWGEQKVRTIKKQLSDADLIRDKKTFGEKNVITGHYVEIVHTCSFPQCGESHSMDKATVWTEPQCGESHSMENDTPNAYITNNKMLNTNSEIHNTDKEIHTVYFNATQAFENYTQDSELRDLLSEWAEIRKAKNKPNTEKAISLELKRLSEHASSSGLSERDYMAEVVRRGWATLYPIERKTEKTKSAYGVKSVPSASPPSYDINKAQEDMNYSVPVYVPKNKRKEVN